MLSLSMIVRDEEARLGECLASVQGFADELVVVDTGSTDATVAIAEAAGARVHDHQLVGKALHGAQTLPETRLFIAHDHREAEHGRPAGDWREVRCVGCCSWLAVVSR